MLCRSPPPSRVSKGLNLASLHALSPRLGRGDTSPAASLCPQLLPASPVIKIARGGHDGPAGGAAASGWGAGGPSLSRAGLGSVQWVWGCWAGEEGVGCWGVRGQGDATPRYLDAALLPQGWTPGDSWYPQPALAGSAPAGAGISRSQSCLAAPAVSVACHTWVTVTRETLPRDPLYQTLSHPPGAWHCWEGLGTSMPLEADPLILSVVPKEMRGFSPDLLMALFFGVTCSPGGIDWRCSGWPCP